MSPANTQYSNTAAYYQYLTQEVLLDEADELGRNTVLCRMVYQNMVQFRSPVH